MLPICNRVYDHTNDTPKSFVENLQSNEHALIGLSPFNSYFSLENIQKIIYWALENFTNIHIFVPDEIYQYTFQALGYTIERARQKTKKQDNYLVNKIMKALLKCDIPEQEVKSKIMLLSSLKKNKYYLNIYNDCLNLFENNEYFREGCIYTSEWILKGKGISNNLINDNIIKIAVKYFLSELPLFMDTPNILNVPSSIFVYKDIPKFLESIYTKKIFIASNQGFLKPDM